MTAPNPDAADVARRWYRKPLCWTGLCNTFSPQSDASGCWGECSICHKRVGFVDRVTLRRYADAEAAAQATGAPGKPL